MGISLRGAELDRLRNQCVCGLLIGVFLHADYMKGLGDTSNLDHFDESDQFIVEISADKRAPIRIRGTDLFNSLKVFPVVPERPTLAILTFVVDAHNALDQGIVKLYLFDDYPLLCGFFACRSYVGSRALVPPIAISGNQNHGKTVPFLVVRKPRSDIRQLLRKGEKVRV